MGAFKQFLSESSLDQLKSNWKNQGLDISLSEDKTTLSLGKISVPKEKRNQGIGSNFMKELIRYADKVNKKIVLSPSTDFGGSSVSRLKDFYKSFGFVENKGRNKDFTISYSMYREPKLLKENPDRVSNSIWWKSNDSLTFGYINNKFHISKQVTNHPDFAIDLLNKKQISMSDLPKDVQQTMEVSRKTFKYAGRLWTKEKIISFWEFPSKNDFDKLIQDAKKTGINIDDSWKVDVEAGPINILEPITNYSNKFKDIKVKQVDHVVSPMLKTKNKSIVPGNVIKVGRKLPKGVSMAKYNFLTKNEGLDESNQNLERLEKLLKNKIITKQKAIETVTGYIIGATLRRNFGETLDDYFKRNPKEKKNHDEYVSWKNKMVNEDVPTTIAPSSVETGQHANKLGSVGKRKEPSLINNIKDKVKKKLKQKSKKEE